MLPGGKGLPNGNNGASGHDPLLRVCLSFRLFWELQVSVMLWPGGVGSFGSVSDCNQEMIR